MTPSLRPLRVASPTPLQGATPAARQSRFRGVSGTGFASLAFAVVSVVFVSGCSTLAQTPEVEMPRTNVAMLAPQPPVAAVRPATGSLFNPARYRPLFEDRRARMQGDTVTILIVENVSASQKSTSTIDKTDGIKTNIAAVPFLSVAALARAGASADSKYDFAGKGGTESANTFTGSITATVVDVQPNGHLVVAGEKQIGVNQNVDVLRFSGTVDPRAIQANSVVNSLQVANVRIESRGRGAQQEAQVMPWLNRFFMNVLPF